MSSIVQNAPQKTGVLLINLGTPSSPTVPAIRTFLRQFLMDPFVVDVPAILRALIVYGSILPTRPKLVQPAYEKIWTEAGSPLMVHSNALARGLQQALGDDYLVALGMRYGEPSIQSAIVTLQSQQLSRLIVLPLFPQSARATTTSALAAVMRAIQPYAHLPRLDIIPSFYDQPFFIKSTARVIQQSIQAANADFVLFSYHGLPERQVEKCRPGGHPLCSQESPCPAISSDNYFCYRAQCFDTSRSLAKTLWLESSQYKTVFQSRVGKLPWIGPQLTDVLPALAQKGIKRLAVACPAFVTDCLETLEEIGLQAKEQWAALGGESLTLLPCLNADPVWVKALSLHIKTEVEGSNDRE